MEGNDSMNNYDMPYLEEAFKKVGFTCEYSLLANSEEACIEDFL